MMTTNACALVNAASAVEPDDVDDATVPTSARPITISSSTNSIFISALEASEGLKIFDIDMDMSMVVKESHSRDDPDCDHQPVPDKVFRVMERDWRVEDEVPCRPVENRRYQWKLRGEGEGKEEPFPAGEEQEEVDQIIRRVVQKEIGRCVDEVD